GGGLDHMVLGDVGDYRSLAAFKIGLGDQRGSKKVLLEREPFNGLGQGIFIDLVFLEPVHIIVHVVIDRGIPLFRLHILLLLQQVGGPVEIQLVYVRGNYLVHPIQTDVEINQVVVLAQAIDEINVLSLPVIQAHDHLVRAASLLGDEIKVVGGIIAVIDEKIQHETVPRTLKQYQRIAVPAFFVFKLHGSDPSALGADAEFQCLVLKRQQLFLSGQGASEGSAQQGGVNGLCSCGIFRVGSGRLLIK